jgi:FKBP-type peptidyl-prolyl cis-trans isomerase FkpA
MFKKLTILALALVVFAACDKNKVTVTESGLKYQMHKHDEKGKKAKMGDILTMHLLLKVTSPKDSVMNDTYKAGSPLKIVLQPSGFKGSFEEGLAMMAEGDSATFFVSADSLFGKQMQPMPPFITKGSDLKFTVTLIKAQSKDDFMKAMETHKVDQAKVDAKKIADYVAQNKLTNVQTTASGLSYVILQQGTGPAPAKGNIVSVTYTGKLTNGKVFDSTEKGGGQPFQFPVGMGQVVPGWDEGFMKLNKGTKAILILPSGLGYGAQSPGPGIPEDAVLIFDVELKDFKKQ